MKRIFLALICLTVVLGMCACGQSAPAEQEKSIPTWQEQYDLGIRYLSEGNYQEAIIAFTAAIEIDPKQAPAYVGRGDAYIGLGETEDNLSSAQADYEKAIALDGSGVDIYIKLADLYLLQGEYGEALEILRQGLDTLGENQELSNKLLELENNPPLNDYGSTEWIYRWDYADFDSMTGDQKTIVEAAATAAMNGDYGAMLQVYNLISDAGQLEEFNIEDTSYSGYVVSSIWDGFKIRLQIYENTDLQVTIEMRPENDTGYYLSCDYDSGDATSGEHIICPCVDWQWNGTMHSTEFNNEYGFWREYTGTMKDSLRDGTFTLTYTYPEYRRQSPLLDTYQNGKRLDWSAEDSSLAILSGYVSDNPRPLELLYW